MKIFWWKTLRTFNFKSILINTFPRKVLNLSYLKGLFWCPREISTTAKEKQVYMKNKTNMENVCWIFTRNFLLRWKPQSLSESESDILLQSVQTKFTALQVSTSTVNKCYFTIYKLLWLAFWHILVSDFHSMQQVAH